MRLIQFTRNGQRGVARIDGAKAVAIPGAASVIEIAQAALAGNIKSLAKEIESRGPGEVLDYPALLASDSVLAPVDHPDPAHCLVTGTGLTHLGSADTRDKMHQKVAGDIDSLTDSMKMFKMGLEGGKPKDAKVGVQPEWFYKGDGSCVARPGAALEFPAFALDGGEEPEVAGIYLVAPDGKPWRLGFAIGNEYSDHVMERQNYLYLAHSKLRACAIGPELLVGDLPDSVEGESRIWRNGSLLWKKPFVSGEKNMSHTIGNLEYHHFKYRQFRRPGDLHIHFFGTATLSVGDGIQTQPGDVFEIEAPAFGAALRNPLGARANDAFRLGGVNAL
ncbi:AraD1 family protein [Dongia sp.]|uniref:AraD1 family protein n=1 Tax=Dongia sp. TaxID=1977262 RepID=UPI0035AF6741